MKINKINDCCQFEEQKQLNLIDLMKAVYLFGLTQYAPNGGVGPFLYSSIQLFGSVCIE